MLSNFLQETKKMKMDRFLSKTALAVLLTMSATLSNAMMPGSPDAIKGGKDIIDRDGKYAKTPTIELCVNYHKLTSEKDRKEHLKELEYRAQLSYKDMEMLGKNKVVPGMTMCGMYMNVGTPSAQQTRRLRPMVFKTVHVYDDVYAVTQSGMCVETYERKEGQLPPKLAAEKPLVAPSPTLKSPPLSELYKQSAIY